MQAPLTAAESKRFATTQAEAAFAGIEVRLIEGDDGRARFIATADSVAMTRSFSAITELEAWLEAHSDGQEAAQ